MFPSAAYTPQDPNPRYKELCQAGLLLFGWNKVPQTTNKDGISGASSVVVLCVYVCVCVSVGMYIYIYVCMYVCMYACIGSARDRERETLSIFRHDVSVYGAARSGLSVRSKPPP